jgi:hypothetical protein
MELSKDCPNNSKGSDFGKILHCRQFTVLSTVLLLAITLVFVPLHICDLAVPVKTCPKAIMGGNHRSRHSTAASDGSKDGISRTSRSSGRSTNQVGERGKDQGSFERKAKAAAAVASSLGLMYGVYHIFQEKGSKRAHTKAMNERDLLSKDIDLETQASKSECGRRNKDVDFWSKMEKLSTPSQQLLEEKHWPSRAPYQHAKVIPRRYVEPPVETQAMWRPSPREGDRYRAIQYEERPIEVMKVWLPVQYENVRQQAYYYPEHPKKAESTESYSYSRRSYHSERQNSWKKKEQRSEYTKRWSRRSRRGDYVGYESWNDREYWK